MLASRSIFFCFILLEIARATRLEDNSLYHVVEDSVGNETEKAAAGELTTCLEIMARNGLNFSSFWHGAAHGLHSIHLEEIRHFFEPLATENNKIPVVNKILSSQQTILFDAPLAGYDEHFYTMALKVMAFFMRNDAEDFFEQGLNTLEKLTHQYHMHEIYAAAAPIYKKMKENPPTDPELCGCVNDITGNGILTELVNIAKKLKYFQQQRRMARTPRCACPGTPGLPGCYSRTYRGYNVEQCRRRRDVSPYAEDYERDDKIAKLEEEYLSNPTHETAYSLLQANPWKGNTLVGPDQWISYQAMLTDSMINAEELNDFATFMYCKLNQPQTDHPKDLFV